MAALPAFSTTVNRLAEYWEMYQRPAREQGNRNFLVRPATWVLPSAVLRQ